MVRLVFRPYTQISRSICTSESLRASTRVSPGFALFRHSSPSFGSQHARSHSNLVPEETWSVDGAALREGFPPAFTFTAHGGLNTPVLAGMLDSLVRVSRRGKENHFVRTGQSRDDTPRYSPSEERLPSEAQTPATLPGPGHDRNANQRPGGRRRSGTVRHWFPSLPFQQFQALFNSLFKVLCIFPSRYLFAIGLPPVFSFRWNLPPALSCNPKQLDS